MRFATQYRGSPCITDAEPGKEQNTRKELPRNVREFRCFRSSRQTIVATINLSQGNVTRNTLAAGGNTALCPGDRSYPGPRNRSVAHKHGSAETEHADRPPGRSHSTSCVSRHCCGMYRQCFLNFAHCAKNIAFMGFDGGQQLRGFCIATIAQGLDRFADLAAHRFLTAFQTAHD